MYVQQLYYCKVHSEHHSTHSLVIETSCFLPHSSPSLPLSATNEWVKLTNSFSELQSQPALATLGGPCQSVASYNVGYDIWVWFQATWRIILISNGTESITGLAWPLLLDRAIIVTISLIVTCCSKHSCFIQKVSVSYEKWNYVKDCKHNVLDNSPG